MNAKSIRLTAALFACLLAVSSCGTTSDQEKETTGAQTGSAADETVTEAVTEAQRFDPQLPAKDFGGAEKLIYARIFDDVWSANDVLSHEQDGDIINDALAERTAYVEETYNVKLNLIPSDNTWMIDPIKNAVSAGDVPYEAVVAKLYDLAVLAQSGVLLDLNEIDALGLSEPWWAQKTNASMSIAGKQFYAVGDLLIVDNKATRVFYFNKDMISEFDLENPYDLVFENKWTVEKFMEYNNAVTGDLDGDNKITREKDRYGTMAQPNLGAVLYIGAGEHVVDNDENGIPYIACESERALSVMTGISEIIGKSDSISLSWDMTINGKYPDNLMYFQDGRVLFSPEVLAHIETMRGCDVDIGILPPPKYDTAQEEYYCYADGWCINALAMPVTNDKPDEIGLLLNALAADSINNLTPAYYEVALTDKFARDQESVKMLDLIIDSLVVDNSDIFSWSGVFNVLSDAIYNGDALSSTVERYHKPVQNAINKTVKAMTEGQ